ncbi:hypothetical protein GQ54DRAFT_323531, partial [Martensiomyces pterosporus]
MPRQQLARQSARVPCSQCPDRRHTYNANELECHKRKEHQMQVKVSHGNKILVFTRNGHDFPCACGGWYKCQSLKKHARNCVLCMDLVHNARPGEKIYVRPPPAALLYQPAGPSAAQRTPMASSRAVAVATEGGGALHEPVGTYIHVQSPHSTDSNDSDDSATYSTDANGPTNTRTQPAAAAQATAAVNEMFSQYLGGHSDQDPASADDLRNIQQWILSLKWNTLYDELGTLHIRRRVFRLLAAKPRSTPRGRLLRTIIRRLFSLEQAQISTRSFAYRCTMQTTRLLNNNAPQRLLAWRSITSTGGNSNYALTCTKFIMALIQFSSDDTLASYLRLTPLQRELASELASLLRGHVPGVNSESESEPGLGSEPEPASSSASESDHGLVVMSESESELGSESGSELDVEVVIE